MDSINEEHKEMIFVFIFFFQMNHLQYFFKEELFESECKRNIFLGSLLSLEGLFDIEFIEKPHKFFEIAKKIELDKYYEINKQMITSLSNNKSNNYVHDYFIESTKSIKFDPDFNYNDADDFFILINSDYDSDHDCEVFNRNNEKASQFDLFDKNISNNISFDLQKKKDIGGCLFNEKLGVIKDLYKKLSSDLTRDESKLLLVNRNKSFSSLNLQKNNCHQIISNYNCNKFLLDHSNEKKLMNESEHSDSHCLLNIYENLNLNESNFKRNEGNNLTKLDIIRPNAMPFNIFKQNMVLFNAIENIILNFNSKLKAFKLNNDKYIERNNNLNIIYNNQPESELNYGGIIQESCLDIDLHMNKLIEYFNFFVAEVMNTEKILNFLLLNNNIFNFLDFESANIDYFFNNKDILIEEFKKFMS